MAAQMHALQLASAECYAILCLSLNLVANKALPSLAEWMLHIQCLNNGRPQNRDCCCCTTPAKKLLTALALVPSQASALHEVRREQKSRAPSKMAGWGCSPLPPVSF